jgi:hypothetical protein
MYVRDCKAAKRASRDTSIQPKLSGEAELGRCAGSRLGQSKAVFGKSGPPRRSRVKSRFGNIHVMPKGASGKSTRHLHFNHANGLNLRTAHTDAPGSVGRGSPITAAVPGGNTRPAQAHSYRRSPSSTHAGPPSSADSRPLSRLDIPSNSLARPEELSADVAWLAPVYTVEGFKPRRFGCSLQPVEFASLLLCSAAPAHF